MLRIKITKLNRTKNLKKLKWSIKILFTLKLGTDSKERQTRNFR